MIQTSFRRASTPEEKKVENILGKLGKLKYADLQAACIIRGMDFEDLNEGDFGRLEMWLLKNWDNPKKRVLLEAYDDFMDKELKKLGYKKRNPIRQYRKFSYLDNEEVETKVKGNRRKAELPPIKAPKKERNEQFGIFTGTKKEYTYKLTRNLHKQYGHKYNDKALISKFIPQMIIKVKKKFPNAVEKSIRIWMKRALNELNK